MVYERLYGPLGGQRADYLASMVAATTAAAFSKKPPPLSDFMPQWEQMTKEAARGDDP